MNVLTTPQERELMPILLIVAVVLFVLASPLATIAALNALFGLTIPFTFTTWLAIFWLHIVVASRGESDS